MKAFNQGFSILEQSVAITILSILISQGMMVSERLIDNQKYNETVRRITIVEKAIIAYYLQQTENTKNHFLCPSGAEIIMSHSDFGKEKCFNDDGIITKGGYYYGSIPIRSLELPDFYMFDGWGRRMSFVVSQQLNSDSNHTLYHIISHGSNGKGAYDQDGFQSVLSENAAEKSNSITTKYTTEITNYVMEEEFDDIVVSKNVIEFIRDISGGILLSKAFCDFLDTDNTSSKECNLLQAKIKSLCV